MILRLQFKLPQAAAARASHRDGASAKRKVKHAAFVFAQRLWPIKPVGTQATWVQGTGTRSLDGANR